jgi:hypothetical protein
MERARRCCCVRDYVDASPEEQDPSPERHDTVHRAIFSLRRCEVDFFVMLRAPGTMTSRGGSEDSRGHTGVPSPTLLHGARGSDVLEEALRPLWTSHSTAHILYPA